MTVVIGFFAIFDRELIVLRNVDQKDWVNLSAILYRCTCSTFIAQRSRRNRFALYDENVVIIVGNNI